MMRRVILFLAALGASTGAAAAQTVTFSERCTATETCEIGGACKEGGFSFLFHYVEWPDREATSEVQFGSGPRIETVNEPGTQGFAFATEGRIFTMLYLFNDAYEPEDDPDFVLLEARDPGRRDTVRIHAGRCEVID